MPYNPKHIANFLIEKALAEDRPLTPMKIIKLTYIAHGWYLALKDIPLIDEVVEAWKYGPVISSLYHKLKQYSNGPVGQRIESDIPECKVFEQDNDTKQFLTEIWLRYKEYTATRLAAFTHAEGTPWSETIKPFLHKGFLPAYLPIDNELIKRHYKQLLESAK